jgi:hypothetical protein
MKALFNNTIPTQKQPHLSGGVLSCSVATRKGVGSIPAWFDYLFLSYMEYLESIFFVPRNEIFFKKLRDFTSKAFLYPKNQFREKKIVCHVPLPPTEICATPTAWTIRPRNLKF